MCDEHFEEDLKNYMRFPPLTRRQFGAVSVGAGVVVWPDILGLRPAFRQMGKRLAESGYAVLA